MERVNEGAESVIYETELGGKPILVKSRERKSYREPKLDESLRSGRTKREAKLLRSAALSGAKVPSIAATGRYTIFMEKLPGKPLKDMAAKRKDLFMIGRYLALMHNNRITHGDFTAANILITRHGPYIIDFGLGGFSDSEEDKALDLLLMERSVGKIHYSEIIAGYKSKARNTKATLSRLSEIKKRGRYQTRTIT